MIKLKRQFLDDLVKIGAFKFGTFTLVSGRTSPYYVNLRVIRSFPGVFENAREIIWNLIKDLEFDRISDVPTGSIPLVASLVIPHQISMISPHPPKDHGGGMSIDGYYKPGERVVVVEDVVTSGGSILDKAVKFLKAEGLVVKDVCVLIDRQAGGRKKLAEAGIQLHPAFTVNEIIEYLQKHPPEGISDEQITIVHRYLQNTIS